MRTRPKLEAPIAEHVRTDCARLKTGDTLGSTLEALRRAPPVSERIVYFYVVDADGRLRGVVPTRQLLFGSPEMRIDDLMIARVVSLRAGATVREACELFALHRFLALPVVDADNRLQGVVDVELYTDELDELSDAQKRADLFQSIGVYAGSVEGASPVRAFGKRFPWLLCNLGGGLICAVLAGLFKAELAQAVALAMFIPVVLNLAESVSSQSVSLTLHALHGRTASWSFVQSMLARETGTGALLGAACGAIVGATALLWLGQAPVAGALLGGIAAGVVISALLGLTMPVLLRLVRLDPKVAAGPIALAGADVTTLFAYLALARWFLGLSR
jgi:magnesium transporter